MAEAIGIGASIISLLQLSYSVISVCYNYKVGVRNASRDVDRIMDLLIGLRTVLEQLVNLANHQGLNQKTLEMLNGSDGPIIRCGRELHYLMKELQSGNGWRKRGQALLWPLKEVEIKKTIEHLESGKSLLQLALTADHTSLSLEIHENVTSIQHDVANLSMWTQLNDLGNLDTLRQKIIRWLSPPDPSSNHHDACKKHQPKTGSWFTGGFDFAKWKSTCGSSLWLYGNTGCGKTILCSTVIKALSGRKMDSSISIAYFYFDFSDNKKQTFEGLIKSLIVQLASHYPATPTVLQTFYNENQNGGLQPSTTALVEILRSLIGGLSATYFLIDALDECRERESLLEWVRHVVDEKIPNLRILLTSRNEREIENCLALRVSWKLGIQGAMVDADILTHINERLRNDSRLNRWPFDLQEEMRKALKDGAQGMFRWVYCQLDAFRKCIKVSQLRDTLNSVPKSLDETYDRMLLEIEPQYKDDAIKILQWVAFSARPVTLAEIAEVVAIDGPSFCTEQRLPDPYDILFICPGLISMSSPAFPSHDSEWFGTDLIGYLHSEKSTAGQLRLSHFSVKEYLLSRRIHLSGGGPGFGLNKRVADTFIAQSCLGYLMELAHISVLSNSTLHEFPLARYAAKYWVIHAKSDDNLVPDTLDDMIRLLLQPQSMQFVNWIRLCKPELSWKQVDLERHPNDIPHPLYYASLHGLGKACKAFLDAGANVNAPGVDYGNALQAAVGRGHEAVVRMLLDSGANVNAQGGYYGSALQVASHRDYEAMVQLLLNAGADVNALGGQYGCAVQAASLEGRVEVVQALLQAGADINSESGQFGTALQAASYGGRYEVVRFLLGAGADVNITGGTYGNALQATFSCGEGSKVVAPLLLDAGADVNMQGGYYGNALQAASYRGDTFSVRQLLNAGAEINAKGGEYQSSILAASHCGNAEVMELLIEAGADVKIVRGNGIVDVLESACRDGREDVVRLLLAAASPIDTPEIILANALQEASDSGHASVRRLLLDAGADPTVSQELFMHRQYTSNINSPDTDAPGKTYAQGPAWQTYFGLPDPIDPDIMRDFPPPQNKIHTSTGRQRSDKKKRDAEREMETLLGSNGIHISGRANQILAMVDLFRKMAEENIKLRGSSSSASNDQPSLSKRPRSSDT